VGDNGDEVPVDPGWRDAWHGVLWAPTVFLLSWHIRRAKLPQLLVFRRLFVMFGSALLLFGAARAALGSEDRSFSANSAVSWGVVIAVFGLVLQFVVTRFLDPPIPCGEAREVAGAYGTKFFLKVAFANVPALFGFVFSFTTNYWWMYLFGVVPAAVGYTRLAPTRASIEREWRDLELRGCDVNLLAGLMASPSG
jgi:hypothetical protein